jgi:hypothetical protein
MGVSVFGTLIGVAQPGTGGSIIAQGAGPYSAQALGNIR